MNEVGGTAVSLRTTSVRPVVTIMCHSRVTLDVASLPPVLCRMQYRRKHAAILLFAVTSAFAATAAAGGESSFTATGAMTTPRVLHTATLLPDGKVLVAGGTDELHFLDTAELYDPDRGTFTPTSTPMTSRRENHTATLLRNGKVLIAGGYDGSQSVRSAELYDPASGTFTAISIPSSTLTIPKPVLTISESSLSSGTSVPAQRPTGAELPARRPGCSSVAPRRVGAGEPHQPASSCCDARGRGYRGMTARGGRPS
jgi:hypothetical protein